MASPTFHPLVMTDGRDPWEMQDGEMSSRYYWFCKFRDLGMRRTQIEVSKIYELEDRVPGVEYSEQDIVRRVMTRQAIVTRLYKYENWAYRVKEYDKHMAQILLVEKERAAVSAVRKASDMHAQVAGAIVALSGKRLKKLHDVADNTGLPEMSFDTLLSYARVGIELHRKVLGIMEDPVQSKTVSDEQFGRGAFEVAKQAAREAAAEEAAAERRRAEVVIEPPTDAVETDISEEGDGDDSGE